MPTAEVLATGPVARIAAARARHRFGLPATDLDDLAQVAAAVAGLPGAVRKVVAGTYGIGVPAVKGAVLAETLGVTPARVARLKAAGLARLRAELTGTGPRRLRWGGDGVSRAGVAPVFTASIREMGRSTRWRAAGTERPWRCTPTPSWGIRARLECTSSPARRSPVRQEVTPNPSPGPAAIRRPRLGRAPAADGPGRPAHVIHPGRRMRINFEHHLGVGVAGELGDGGGGPAEAGVGRPGAAPGPARPVRRGRGGPGMISEAMWATLDVLESFNCPVTAHQIAARRRRSRTTADLHLKLLEARGLARRAGVERRSDPRADGRRVLWLPAGRRTSG